MEFFLVTLPGLEDIVQTEVHAWFPNVETRVDHGGVTVFTELERGLSMNLVLKTPTRILLRVAQFRCRDFPKLFNTIAKMPWRKWIDPGCEMTAHASTRLSRLKIKARIEETCVNGWHEYQKKNKGNKNAGKVDLYVRILNDECTLSLDTSGERLHKRGERQHVGEAPLRETIAAAMIQMASMKFPDHQDIELVDPMMGSGTFLLEGAGRDTIIEKRGFAFENFAAQPKEKPKVQAERPRFSKLIGFEADEKTLKAAQTNLKSIDALTELHREDFFKAKPLPSTQSKRWLFSNPPYGERLKVKEPLLEYYEKLFLAAEQIAKPDLAYFLLPAKVVKGKFVLPLGWKVIEKRPFLNGGIPVVAFGFTRK